MPCIHKQTVILTDSHTADSVHKVLFPAGKITQKLHNRSFIFYWCAGAPQTGSSA